MTKKITITDIARVCHEANRALQMSVGDLVSPEWDSAPESQRASAIDGVRASLSGLSHQEMHVNWMEFKKDAGWVFGVNKSEEEKTHPCMVAYEDLPAEQQVKDALFGNIVKTLRVLLINAGDFNSYETK